MLSLATALEAHRTTSKAFFRFNWHNGLDGLPIGVGSQACQHPRATATDTANRASILTQPSPADRLRWLSKAWPCR